MLPPAPHRASPARRAPAPVVPTRPPTARREAHRPGRVDSPPRLPPPPRLISPARVTVDEASTAPAPRVTSRRLNPGARRPRAGPRTSPGPAVRHAAPAHAARLVGPATPAEERRPRAGERSSPTREGGPSRARTRRSNPAVTSRASARRRPKSEVAGTRTPFASPSAGVALSGANARRDEFHLRPRRPRRGTARSRGL